MRGTELIRQFWDHKAHISPQDRFVDPENLKVPDPSKAYLKKKSGFFMSDRVMPNERCSPLLGSYWRVALSFLHVYISAGYHSLLVGVSFSLILFLCISKPRRVPMKRLVELRSRSVPPASPNGTQKIPSRHTGGFGTEVDQFHGLGPYLGT